MSSSIPGNESVRQRLHERLSIGRVVAFVGAGASAPIYPLWGELLRELIDSCVSQRLATEAEANFWITTGDKRPQEVVQGVREKLGQSRFGNLVADLFRTKRAEDGLTFTPTHRALLRANFGGFITTNYDSGLLDAKIVERPDCGSTGFWTWKDEFVNHWSTGDIFTEDPCPILFCHGFHQRPDTIVLGIDEYRDAYRRGPWRRCLEALWTREHFVFVGFGFNDTFVDSVVGEVLTEMEALKREKPRHIALIGLKPNEPYSSEMRRLYLNQYNAEVLFYEVRQQPDGSYDHACSLLSELDALPAYAAFSKHPQAAHLRISASQSCEAEIPSGGPMPSIWCHETTEDGKYLVRPEVLRRLDRWCADKQVRLISITGIGGLGKTSLVGYWLKREHGWRHRTFVGLFYWSFYSNRNIPTFAQHFLNFCENIVQIDASTEIAPAVLIDRACKLLRTFPFLVVLDGVEVLQELPESPQYGAVVDPELQRLLIAACMHGSGLVILTSRFSFPDLSRFYGRSVRGLDLRALTNEEGFQLLQDCGVNSRSEEIELASLQFGGHPLALRIFAAALSSIDCREPGERFRLLCDAVKLSPEHGQLSEPERRVRSLKQLLSFYESQLPKTHSALLSIVALFSSPVATSTISELAHRLPVFAPCFHCFSRSEIDHQLATMASGYLLNRGEMSTGSESSYSTHPVLRDYFRSSLIGRKGVPQEFAQILSSQPDQWPKTEEYYAPFLDAIELLLESGDFKGAHQLCWERVASWRAFMFNPSSFANQRSALGFVADDNRQNHCRQSLGPGILASYLWRIGFWAAACGELSLARNFLETSRVACESTSATEARTPFSEERYVPYHLTTEEKLAARYVLGLLNLELGNCSAAEGYMTEALKIASVENDPADIASVIFAQAHILSLQGKLRAAAERFLEGNGFLLEIARRDENAFYVHSELYKAHHLIQIRGYNLATYIADSNLSLLESIEADTDRAGWASLRGYLAIIGGDRGMAKRQLVDAERIIRNARLTVDRPRVLLAQAELERMEGHRDTAFDRVEEALALAAPREMVRAHVETLLVRANLRLTLGNGPDHTSSNDSFCLAYDDAEAALTIARRSGDVWGERDALQLLAHIEGRLGHRASEHNSNLLALTERLEREIRAAQTIVGEHYRKRLLGRNWWPRIGNYLSGLNGSLRIASAQSRSFALLEFQNSDSRMKPESDYLTGRPPYQPVTLPSRVVILRPYATHLPPPLWRLQQATRRLFRRMRGI